MINYYSIQNKIINTLEINKSKFKTYLFPIASIEDFQTQYETIKKDHSKANHHCSAYIFGLNQHHQKANDDGEPSGTAGYPMLEVLKQNDLTNIGTVVVRYFGGIKLGSGGLIRAYSSSVSEALHEAQITANVIQEIYSLMLPYQNNDIFQYFIDQTAINVQILDTQYTDKIEYTLGLFKEDIDPFFKEVNQRLNGNFQHAFVKEQAIDIPKF